MGCGPPGPADLLWRQIWDVLGGDRGVDVRLEGDRMTWIGDAERLEFERV